MQLKIPSDKHSMDRLKGKNHKSTEKSVQETDTKTKLNGHSTPRRSKRKASESSSTSTVQNGAASIEKRQHKISESSHGDASVQSIETKEKGAEKSPSGQASGVKRKASNSGATEALSVSERIKLLSHDQNQKSTPPRTDSVLQLLLQGLNDVNIVGPVLERADDELINDTVKRLPSDKIVPLLTILHQYLQSKKSLIFSHGKWLKAVLQHHTAQVMISPECEKILTSMRSIIETRTKNYFEILQLRGKLEMMIGQTTAQSESQNEDLALPSSSKEALLVYQDDESSNESPQSPEDMIIHETSDTDNDDWDNDADDSSSDDDDDDQVHQVLNGNSSSSGSEDDSNDVMYSADD